MDHLRQALEHVDKALGEGDGPWIHLGVAGVHAMLHLASEVRHGLRDILYEMRS